MIDKNNIPLVLDKFQVCNCPGCQSPYVQLVAGNILWFEIPKNGSSSIKQALEKKYGNPNPWVGVPHIHLNTVDFSQVNSYAIIRNPYDRFLSAYHQFVTKKGLFSKTLSDNNIDKSIVNVIDNIHLFDERQRIHHFYPQYHFLKDFIDNIELIPIEKIDTFFDMLGVESITRNSFKKERPTIDSLTDEEKEKIYYLHKEDFEHFNFKKL